MPALALYLEEPYRLMLYHPLGVSIELINLLEI
jgi:hypothetical protein